MRPLVRAGLQGRSLLAHSLCLKPQLSSGATRNLGALRLTPPSIPGSIPPAPSPPASWNVSPARRQREASTARETAAPLVSFHMCYSRFPGCSQEPGEGRPGSTFMAQPWGSRPRTQGLHAVGQAAATWPALPWQLSLPTPDLPSCWPTPFPKGSAGCQKEFSSRPSVHAPLAQLASQGAVASPCEAGSSLCSPAEN